MEGHDMENLVYHLQKCQRYERQWLGGVLPGWKAKAMPPEYDE